MSDIAESQITRARTEAQRAHEFVEWVKSHYGISCISITVNGNPPTSLTQNEINVYHYFLGDKRLDDREQGVLERNRGTCLNIMR